MTEIIVTAIITALATILIMIIVIGYALADEDDKKDKKTEDRIAELEDRIKNISLENFNRHTLRGYTILELGERINKLEKKFKELENNKFKKKFKELENKNKTKKK